MGKIYMEKTPSGDFKITTLENSLLSQQAVTSKKILIPYTNLQLNSYPNTQLDLFCSDNLFFQCMTPSMWLTNRCADLSMRLTNRCTDPVRDLITNLRKMLDAKFFSSSHDEDQEAQWPQKPTMYKHSSFFKRKMN